MLSFIKYNEIQNGFVFFVVVFFFLPIGEHLRDPKRVIFGLHPTDVPTEYYTSYFSGILS